MATASAAPDREFARPDTAFAFACGLYTSAMITPITAFLAHAAVSGTTRLVLAVLSIGVALVGVGTVGAARLPGLPEALGGSSWSWLLVVAPLLGTASVLASTVLPSVRIGGSTSLLVALAGLASAFAGLVVVAMASTRHAAWMVDEETVDATWQGRWPRRSRRRVWALAGVIVVLGAVGFVLGSLREVFWLEFGGQVAVPVGLVLAVVGRDVTYRATDRGLELRTPLVRRFVSWDALDGFRVTADALVLVRSPPWRLSLRCARADIDDVEAVVAVLDEHLDRLA